MDHPFQSDDDHCVACDAVGVPHASQKGAGEAGQAVGVAPSTPSVPAPQHCVVRHRPHIRHGRDHRLNDVLLAMRPRGRCSLKNDLVDRERFDVDVPPPSSPMCVSPDPLSQCPTEPLPSEHCVGALVLLPDQCT